MVAEKSLKNCFLVLRTQLDAITGGCGFTHTNWVSMKPILLSILVMSIGDPQVTVYKIYHI